MGRRYNDAQTVDELITEFDTKFKASNLKLMNRDLVTSMATALVDETFADNFYPVKTGRLTMNHTIKVPLTKSSRTKAEAQIVDNQTYAMNVWNWNVTGVSHWYDAASKRAGDRMAQYAVPALDRLMIPNAPEITHDFQINRLVSGKSLRSSFDYDPYSNNVGTGGAMRLTMHKPRKSRGK